MHPELEHAFDTGVSMQEVIEIFAKYYCGPEEKSIDYSSWEGDIPHDSSKFWDNWHPLFHSLSVYEVGRRSINISDPSLSIHRALTRDVISWLCDSKRKSNIYLINESWMPGEDDKGYSRAAAMGKICSHAQRFGHSFYAGPPYGRISKIGQLSAELAAAYPSYRHILTQILIDYPGIYDLSHRSLFKKLIHEPWKAVQHRHPVYITAPPVVVVYCHKPYAEALFHSICEFGSSSHSSPLLWIISIGPKFKFKLPMQGLVEPFTPRYVKPQVCYNEGLVDAELTLNHKFDALRHKYNQTFGHNEVWPSDQQIAQLARVVLGVFEFIDVIIQFIDWEGDGGPRAHLETFLGYMVDSPPPLDEQRYRALDHFYTRALSSIPPDVFLDVQEAFSIIHWEIWRLKLVQLLSLLSFRFGTFLPYFHRLVSLRRYHNKNSCTEHFRRFIEDSKRSGQFYTPKSESCLRVYQAWLNSLSHSSDLRIILKPPVLQFSQADLTEAAKQLGDLRHLAPLRVCDMQMARVNKALLRGFDFRCLAHNCDSIHIEFFADLISDLHRWDEADCENSPKIVRVEPVSTLDGQFIDRCQGLAEPYNLRGKTELPLTNAKYVLLGYEGKTVLAVMTPRKQYHNVRGNARVVTEEVPVTIYTSAMLDYM